MKYEIEKQIDKIIKDNIKEIPYEGKDVNTNSLKEDIYNLVHQSKTYTKDEVKTLLYQFSTKVFSEKFNIEDTSKWIEENL